MVKTRKRPGFERSSTPSRHCRMPLLARHAKDWGCRAAAPRLSGWVPVGTLQECGGRTQPFASLQHSSEAYVSRSLRKQPVAGRASGREWQLTGGVANSRSRPKTAGHRRPLCVVL